MSKITFKTDILHNFEKAIEKEYLITNGIGGYSSSTIIGCNTRKYHGLLIESNPLTLERRVTLSLLNEVLILEENGKEVSYNLSTIQYLNKTTPQGYKYLEEFSYEYFPTFIYRIKNVKIEKEIFMVHGENTVYINYKITSPGPVKFKIYPILTYRLFHEIKSKKKLLNNSLNSKDSFITLKDSSKKLLFNVYGKNLTFAKDKNWYKKIYYKNEHLRGYDCLEDLICQGYYQISGKGNLDFFIAASDKRKTFPSALQEKKKQLSRIEKVIKLSKPKDQFEKTLAYIADSFLIEKKEKSKLTHSIIAGYPWFGDWGRDTMISLPGLTLATGRKDIAKSILAGFSNKISKGLLPNTYTEKVNKPQYNTVDASLWYINALYEYYLETQDKAFVKQMLPKVKEIIKYYVQGTRFGIKMDKDHLITCGKFGNQVTWLDAKLDNKAITPRQGKPVEIQALWYNALRITIEFCKLFKEDISEYAELADNIKISFKERFLFTDRGYFYDYIYKDYKDISLRPNQLYVLNLPFTMFEEIEFERIATYVISWMKKHLLTKYGLKSLSNEHPSYMSTYEGNPYQRDKAYHHGTIWPYMIGAFIETYLKIVNNKNSKKIARDLINNFIEHFSDAGIGHVSEIFDAQEPHTPRGCISQAWCIAEIIRVKKKYKL